MGGEFTYPKMCGQLKSSRTQRDLSDVGVWTPLGGWFRFGFWLALSLLCNWRSSVRPAIAWCPPTFFVMEPDVRGSPDVRQCRLLKFCLANVALCPSDSEDQEAIALTLALTHLNELKLLQTKGMF